MSSFSEGCCVVRTVVLQAFGNRSALSFSMCSSGDSVGSVWTCTLHPAAGALNALRGCDVKEVRLRCVCDEVIHLRGVSTLDVPLSRSTELVVSVVTSFTVLHGMRRSLKLHRIINSPSGRFLSSSECERTYSAECDVYGIYIYIYIRDQWSQCCRCIYYIIYIVLLSD